MILNFSTTDDTLLEAMRFVNHAHSERSITKEGRYRKGSLVGIPYFTHCVEVMKKVATYGYNYTNNKSFNDSKILHKEVTYILLACLGHDLFEDTDVTYEEIEEKWGELTALTIKSVTRISGDAATKIQKWEFLETIASEDNLIPKVIKIADRYVNVKDYAIDDAKYAAKYALQAYPVYHSFTAHKYKDIWLEKAVNADIAELDEIIKTRYGKSYLDMSYDEAKGLVI
jgi:(p)ppGpp synthase/HD superfamily hydrolase